MSPKSPAVIWKIGNAPNAINNLVEEICRPSVKVPPDLSLALD